MILCVCCNKKIKVRSAKYLRTCKECHQPACKSCMSKGTCKDCNPLNSDKVQVYEYFRDKYAEQARGTL